MGVHQYNGVDCYVVYSFVTLDSAAPTETPTEVPTDTPTATPTDPTAYADYTAVGENAITNTSSVNIRSTPVSGSTDNLIAQVSQNTEVYVYGTFSIDTTVWAYISYNGTDSYVWNDLLTIVTPTPVPTETATAAPTDTPVATPTATAAVGEPADISGTYPDYTPIGAAGVTNTTSVNIRSTPVSGSTDNLVSQVALGTEVWVHGSFTSGGNTWAYIRYNNVDCYVWLSLLTVETPAVTPTPVATATPTAEPTAEPTIEPTAEPTAEPTTEPTTEPTAEPTAEPTTEPTAEPTTEPTTEPTATPTDTPANMPGENDQPLDISGTYPGYTVVGQPGATNTTGVRFRSTPDSSTDANILFQVSKDSNIWVHGWFNYNNRDWAYIRYATMDCYVWLSLIDIDGSYVTPSPTPTATPTATPTETPTTAPTATPTDTPTTAPTASPTVVPTAIPTDSPVVTPTQTASQLDLYVGFGLTLTQVALRDNANFADNSILTTLPADTLLYLNGQVDVNGTVWTGAQTYLGVSYIGLLPYSSVRTITPGETQGYIDAYNAPTRLRRPPHRRPRQHQFRRQAISSPWATMCPCAPFRAHRRQSPHGWERTRQSMYPARCTTMATAGMSAAITAYPAISGRISCA